MQLGETSKLYGLKLDRIPSPSVQTEGHDTSFTAMWPTKVG